MAEKAGDIFWNIGTDLKSFNAGMRVAQRGAKKLGTSFTRAGKKIGIASGIAGVAIFGLVKKSQAFSEAMAEVNTLGVKDLEGLKDAVKEVSVEFGTDLVNSANAAYQAISAGATEAQTPMLLAEAAQAATAGVTDLSTAIELGTSVSNAFGISLDNVGMVFDDAFTAVKGGVTTFEELSASVGKLSPIMSAAGLSTGEMFAAIGALTKGGLGTAEAVTGIKAAISGILKPTSEATKLAAQLGLQFDATALKTLGLGGFMDQLREKTGGNLETMAQMFGSVEALNVVLALTGSQAESFNALLAEMAHNQGASNEAFDAFVQANPGFMFDQLKAKVEVLAVEIGDRLTPSLLNLTEQIEPLVKTTTDWIRENESLAGTMAGVGVAAVALGLVLTPVLTLLGGMFNGIAFGVSIISGLVALLTGAAAVGIISFGAVVVTLAAAFSFLFVMLDHVVRGFGKLLTARKQQVESSIKLDKQTELAIKQLEKNGGAIDRVALKQMKQEDRIKAVSKALDENGRANRAAAGDIQKVKGATDGINNAMKNTVTANQNVVGAIHGTSNKEIENTNVVNQSIGAQEHLTAISALLAGGFIDIAEAADMATVAVRNFNQASGGGGGGGIGAPIPIAGGTRSAPSGFTGFSGGGGGGGAGFRSSQIAGAQAVTQHININIEGALDADQIVGEIQAPLMRVMASGLKQALA